MILKKITLTFLAILTLVFFFSGSVLASCKIEGTKIYYFDNKELDGSPGPAYIFASRVFVDTSLFSELNPYLITVPEGNYVVSATVPDGYQVGYTLCYNNTLCHTQTPVMLPKVPVSCSSGVNSYIDLWWHYRKLGDIDNNKVVDLIDLIYFLKAFFL